MSDNNKIVKFKKRRNINIGIIVFIIMFIYIAINVYIYFTKEQLSIYEVHEGTTAIDNQITGLVLREEKVFYSERAGYISYYQKEGARVAKNSSIYSVDDNGQMIDLISNGDVEITLTDKNNAEIKHDIKDFQHKFSNDDFSTVYDFKEDAGSTVLDILNSTIISQGQALMEETGITYAGHMIPSQDSGIISYYTDSFEAVTPESVTAEMFNLENYTSTSLRMAKSITQNSPVYKMITSEVWNIVLPLSLEQYEKLTGKDQITFTMIEDDFEMTTKLKLTNRGSDYYALLTMDKHLENYLEERYLDVELDFDTAEGLKIPLTSITTKDFYLVPLEYFSFGAESTDSGLIKETYSETGEVEFTFIPTDIYYQDEAFAYVDTLMFPAGTWIHSSTNSDRYQLTQTNKLTGVYNVNLGYSVFKRIQVLYQNKDYCIIDKNTPNGLSAYDHIALDGSTAVEQAIIY